MISLCIRIVLLIIINYLDIDLTFITKWFIDILGINTLHIRYMTDPRIGGSVNRSGRGNIPSSSNSQNALIPSNPTYSGRINTVQSGRVVPNYSVQRNQVIPSNHVLERQLRNVSQNNDTIASSSTNNIAIQQERIIDTSTTDLEFRETKSEIIQNLTTTWPGKRNNIRYENINDIIPFDLSPEDRSKIEELIPNFSAHSHVSLPGRYPEHIADAATRVNTEMGFDDNPIFRLDQGVTHVCILDHDNDLVFKNTGIQVRNAKVLSEDNVYISFTKSKETRIVYHAIFWISEINSSNYREVISNSIFNRYRISTGNVKFPKTGEIMYLDGTHMKLR